MKSFPLSLLLLFAAAVIVCSSFSLFVSAQDSDDYIRNVTGGLILGYQSTSYPSVGVWKNVPFGTAPRFQNPVPRAPWTGIMNCTQWGPGCSQVCKLPRPEYTCPSSYSEDCLALNIFSPDPSNTAGGFKTVLVFFIGGRFQVGGASCVAYQSDYLAYTQDVVVVTVQYRLGALGALITKNGIRGNFQMKDQLLAVQWIKQNIYKFGGNPNDLVLSGESAGAMSVGCAMTSPKFNGLYTAAIMSSNPLGVPYQNMQIALELGANYLTKVGCSGLGSVTDELSCLGTKSIDVLVNASNSDKLFPWPSTGFGANLVPWSPVVGDVDGFLPMQPMDAAAQGKLYPVPMLIGNNANDSLLFISELSNSPMGHAEQVAVLTAYFGVENMFKIEFMYPPTGIADKRIFLSEVFTDYFFNCPNRYFEAQAAKNQNLNAFFYYFDYMGSYTSWLWETSFPICSNYLCHAADLLSIFAIDKSDVASQIPQFTPSDQAAVTMTETIWGNFAKTKNPQIQGWTPLNQNNYNRFNLQPSNPVVMKDFRSVYCDFYDKVGYNNRGW